MTHMMSMYHNVVSDIIRFIGIIFRIIHHEGLGGKIKPVPDDPRFLYVLDPLWRQIKSIEWPELGIYPIIGLSTIMAFILIFYLIRAWKDHS